MSELITPAPSQAPSEEEISRRVAEIQTRANAAQPGPWRWFGNVKHHEIYLATERWGRRFVMQFTRWGMQNAQPLFQSDQLMRDLIEMAARGEIAVDHNGAIIDIRHPDADFIAHAREDIPFLLAALQSQTARADRAEQDSTDAAVLAYRRGRLDGTWASIRGWHGDEERRVLGMAAGEKYDAARWVEARPWFANGIARIGDRAREKVGIPLKEPEVQRVESSPPQPGATT